MTTHANEPSPLFPEFGLTLTMPDITVVVQPESTSSTSLDVHVKNHVDGTTQVVRDWTPAQIGALVTLALGHDDNDEAPYALISHKVDQFSHGHRPVP